MEKTLISNTLYKRSLLMTRLYWLILILTIVFWLLDLMMGIYINPLLYLVFIVYAIMNIYFVKRGYVEFSKIIGLSIFNILIFLVASSEPFNTGMHLQFVTAGAVALAVFGYEQWKGALGFVLLSLVLDLATFKFDFRLLPWREIGEPQAEVFFLINTVIAASISVYTILLFSKINFESEKSLQENELIIQKQNNMLLKSNAELDRFVYSASHDLRSPLSTLEGLIELAKHETTEGERKVYYELMLNRISSMNYFIDNIIDYSRNSRTEILNEKVNIKALLEEIVDSLKFSPGYDELIFKWKIEEDGCINSDRNRLKVILINLISNSIKYRSTKVDQCWIELKSATFNEKAVIEIEDNGIGISDALHKKVFNMFYRAHDHSKGSGLGLYIVKETVEKLSGSITLESTENKGSKFRIEFPV